MKSRANRGFSLVEVMVALFVIAIGMLGIAKIQALAYSSTGNASIRSIAAIQAASLASAMRANRAYWSIGSGANANITVTGAAVASTDATFSGLLGTAQNCSASSGGASCTVPQVLAAYDLQQWAAALNGSLPVDSAVVACPTASLPINCTISVSWNERIVAIDQKSLNTGGATAINGTQTYTLYVEP